MLSLLNWLVLIFPIDPLIAIAKIKKKRERVISINKAKNNKAIIVMIQKVIGQMCNTIERAIEKRSKVRKKDQ